MPAACWSTARTSPSRPPAKRDIGMVFQNYALFPHLTVAENVAFPLEMRNVAKAEIDDARRRKRWAGRARRLRGAAAAPALGRAAAARGAGPRHRLRPAPPAARRAVRRARPQAARDDAARGPPAAAPARPDDDLHHPRPGGGAGPVRPHRGDEQGRASSRSPARPRSTSGRPPASSPTSWARATSCAASAGAGGRGRRSTAAARCRTWPRSRRSGEKVGVLMRPERFSGDGDATACTAR